MADTAQAPTTPEGETQEPMPVAVVDHGEMTHGAEPPAVVDGTPDGLIALAIRRDLDMDKLERLMQLKRDDEDRRARKAFFGAMARFKAVVPPITKDGEVSYTGTNYKHATLGNVAETIRDALQANGLSYSFDIDQSEGGMTVACVVTHEDGHSERTPMRADADTSGGKNAIQAFGSTLTYLQRYTLIAALGLSTAIEDTDGRRDRGGPPNACGSENWQREPADDPPPPKRKAPALVPGLKIEATIAAIQPEADWLLWAKFPAVGVVVPHVMRGEHTAAWRAARDSGDHELRADLEAKVDDHGWLKMVRTEQHGEVWLATPSNPKKHKWVVGSDVRFEVDEVDFEIDTPNGPRRVTLISEVRLAADPAPEPADTKGEPPCDTDGEAGEQPSCTTVAPPPSPAQAATAGISKEDRDALTARAFALRDEVGRSMFNDLWKDLEAPESYQAMILKGDADALAFVEAFVAKLEAEMLDDATEPPANDDCLGCGASGDAECAEDCPLNREGE